MKNRVVTSFFLILLSPCFLTATLDVNAQENINFSSPETWILGYFTPQQLSAKPHALWFVPEFDNYQYDENVIGKLLNFDLNDVSIKVIMGTWCSDSHREVPRFMKILTAINFPLEKVTFIGVDHNKLAPVDSYDTLQIERVPTFIFYIKNVEAGRIIENPRTSLEQDILNILKLKE
ncbi:MAG: hypothetical protein KBG40_08020 [Bacteroidales bacterium]|nr:hypothetical protein [Bacteroidales bacterium]